MSMAFVQENNLRLSTPAPFNLPRWTEDEADKDVAMNSLQGILSTAVAQPAVAQPTQQRLGLSSLGLPKAREWVQPVTKPTPVVQEPVNKGGDAVRAGAGISAYGYKGLTGVKGTRGDGDYGLQSEFAAALARANAGLKAAGLGTITITDGWRSYEQQVDVKRRKPKLAATAGRSIHGLGYAADIGGTKAQKAWLKANGARYGIYFPVRNEDWHAQLLPSLAQKRWG